MLRANLFAFAALDASVRLVFPVASHQPSFLMQGRVLVSIERQVVHGREQAGNAHIVGADPGAVVTGSTGNQGNAGQFLAGGLDGLALLRGKAGKGFHARKVIPHLLLVAHTGEHREDAFQIGGEAKRPRSHAAPGFRILQNLLHRCRRVGEHPALDRLHNHHGLAVLSCHLIATAGLDGGIVPVRIIDLQLDEFHLGMGGQKFVQFLRGGMERKADMPDKPLGLFFLHEVPEAIAVKNAGTALTQIVQQIKVKVARPGLPQGGFKLGKSLLFAFAAPGRILGGELERLARMAFHQRLPHGILASRIGPRRIKIGKTRLKEHVHHPLRLLHIDLAVTLRQTHQAKAEFFDVFTQIRHSIPLF